MKRYKYRKAVENFLIRLLLYTCGGFLCLPVVLLLSGSIADAGELSQVLSPILEGGSGTLTWHLIPEYPSIEHYIRLLFLSPKFYYLFWNSIKIVLLILGGQMLVGVPAAWAFAVYPFPFRKALFILYIVLMLMPFQVTMLSSYLVLDSLKLLNTQAAVVLPAVFSSFPVFLTYRSFLTIQSGLLEAARMDGAGECYLFVKIGVPLGASGILAALVLGFLEYWNMIEQPLTFLKDRALWPLSLYLPEIGADQAGFAFAAATITLIPAGFVFVLGQDYLEEGIAASGLKE